MSGKFSQDDILAKFSGLYPSFESLDRNIIQDPEDIVNSLKRVVFSTLNSDVDSVYAVIFEFMRVQIAMCLSGISLVSKIEEYSALSRAEPRTGDASRLSEISDIIYSLDDAGSAHKSELLSKLKSEVVQMARSNFGDSGSSSVGITPEDAASIVRKHVVSLENLMSYLVAGLQSFQGVINSYMSAETRKSSFSAQLTSSKASIEKLIESGSSDVSDAVLELAVLYSLLQQEMIKRDITEPKFEGPVVTLPGKEARMEGGTLPFILQAIETAGFDVDQGKTAVVSAGKSPSPVLVKNIPNSLFERPDGGELLSSVPANTSAISADGTSGVTVPFLKNVVKAESVNIIAYLLDSNANPFQKVIKDNGYGHLVNGPSMSFSATITSDVAAPTADGLYHFTGANAVGPLDTPEAGASKIEVRDAGNTVLTTLFDQGNGVLSDAANGIGVVSLGTGEIHLNLSYLGALPVGTWFEMSRYKKSNCGQIDYDTGNFYIDVSTTSCTFQQGTSVSTNYEYYPLGKLVALDGSTPTQIEDSFNKLGVYSHNNVVDDGFGSFGATVLNESQSTNPPIRNPADLVQRVTGSQASFNNKGLQAAVNGNNLEFTATKRGSHSRIAPFNLRDAELNTSPFRPTWSIRPDTFVQALGCVYSSTGDKFGKDTYLVDLSLQESNPGSVNLTSETAQTHLFSGEGVAQSQTKIVGSDSVTKAAIDNASPGDTIEVTHPHKYSVKILSSGDGEAVLSQSLPQQIPSQGIGEVANLSDGYVVKFKITSNNLLMFSTSKESSSKLKVTINGFGFSGESKGYSSSVQLSDINLTPVTEKPGYTIKPNDPVVINDRRVGKVVSVTYPVVKINILPGLQEGVDYTFPFTSLRIEALGYRSWRERSPGAALLSRTISDFMARNTTLYDDINVYVNSGSGHEHYAKAVGFFSSTLLSLLELYVNYEAHTVNTVDSLIKFLEDEKMSLAKKILLALDFSALSNLGVNQVSGQGSLDSFLESVVSGLAGSAELIYESSDAGDSMLNDFVLPEEGDALFEDITAFDLNQGEG